jgi:signal transduction histidine kinase
MILSAVLSLGIGVCLSAPGLTQTEADAQAFVQSASAFAKASGTYKLIKEVNSPTTQFRKGELYIFVVDMDGIVLAHGANPKLVGKDLSERQDTGSVRYIQEMIKVATDKGSGWVDYQFTNPETGKTEAKTTYVEKIDEVVIGCGVYKK